MKTSSYMNAQIYNDGWKRLQSCLLILFVGITVLFTGVKTAEAQDSNFPVNETTFAQMVSSQDNSDSNLLSIQFANVTLQEALELLAEEIKVGFSFNPEVMPDKKVTFSLSNVPPHEVIYKLLEGTNLEPVLPPSKDVIVIREKETVDIAEVLDQNITGLVVDAQTGEALPGVNVIAGGTESSSSPIGTTTDMNGEYDFLVPDNVNTLVFSYVGYQRLEIQINNRSEINVELDQNVQMLEDIVVVGYGFEERGELTGSVAVVNADDIKEVPSHNPLQALQGRVAGLYIQRDGTPGSGTQSILLRGLNTLGENEPLFIIDGQPVGMDKFDLLDPNNIESIQVLKDAAAASIYGSRASNGVIIVTTKTAQPGELRIQINSKTSFQQLYAHREFLNTEQRGQVLWRASVNDGLDPNQHAHYDYQWSVDSNGTPILENMETVQWLDENTQGGIRAADTDWFEEVSRLGLLTENSFSVSSGSDRHSLMASLGHLYNEGVVKYNDFERITFRLNSSLDLLDGKLTIGENIQIATSERTPNIDGVFGGSPIRLAQRVPSILPVYAEDGTFAGPIGAGFSDRMNPLGSADLYRDNTDNVKSAYGSLYVNYDIMENLVFKSNFGFNYNDDLRTRYDRKFRMGFLSRDINALTEENRNTTEWTWFNTLTYDFSIRQHNATILGGIEATQNDFNLLSGYREEFLLETENFFQLDAGTGISEISGNSTGYRLLSYFSKINYSFSNRYLASATLRYDGSSRFGEDKRYGFFPAASLGWRISNESFIQEADALDFISQFTFRVGAGRTGNQRIDNDASFAKFIPGYGIAQPFCCGTTSRPLGSAYDLNGAGSGTLPSGVLQVQLANPDLRWESTDEVNAGIDFGFLEQRITGSFDYFWRETNDILVLPPRLAVLGEGSDRWENGATMENQGWEFTIGYNDQTRANFGYRFDVTVGSFKDKITYLPAAVVRSYPGNIEKTIIGRSITSNFGYVTDGIFQNQSEVGSHADQLGKGIGRLRFKDLNGDGVVNELDQDWLGNELPNFEIGINGAVNYKQFRVSFFFQGVQGADRFNARKSSDIIGLWSGENYSIRTLDAWTPENSGSDIPALSLTDSNNEARTSNYHIEDMSYIKLKNLRISYSLPTSLQQNVGLKQAEVYLAGTELFTISSSDFTGADPENPGAFYPIPRSFTLGLNVAF